MEGEQWELSALARLLRHGSDEDICRFFLLLRPPELADLLEHIEDEERLRVVRLMSAPLASEVLREVQEHDREELLEDMSAKEIAQIVHESKSDDAADIIGALPPEKAEDTLERLEQEEREELKELLEYGEETAGGVMQTELVAVQSELSVKEAIEAVRAADMGDVGEIHEVFVIDSGGRLVGTVSPADLLHAEQHAALRSVLEPNPVTVSVTMDQEELAEIAREHDLAAVPVIDANGVLLGQVLHDDVADVIEEEATEDIAKLAGADPEELFEDSIGFAVRTRALWLLPAFGGILAVSFLLGSAEAVFQNLPILAAFLPMVMGMAGNVGTQTSVITVRGLALGRIEPARYRGVIVRQVFTGLALGVIFGAILFAVVVIWKGDRDQAGTFALALGLSLLTAMTVGTAMGVLVPLILHRLGFDPAIATTPFVQTANDLTGAGIILFLAHAIGVFG